MASNAKFWKRFTGLYRSSAVSLPKDNKTSLYEMFVFLCRNILVCFVDDFRRHFERQINCEKSHGLYWEVNSTLHVVTSVRYLPTCWLVCIISPIWFTCHVINSFVNAERVHYSRSSLNGHTRKRTALLMAAALTKPLHLRIPVSGQLQMWTIVLLPEGVRLQEMQLYF